MDNPRKYTGPKYRIRYEEEFKHQICREFISGNYTKTELQDKYGIKGKSRLFSWLNELGYTEYIREKGITIMRKYTVKKKLKIPKQAAEDLKALETALQDAQIKAEAYSKMIEIAEKKYKIKIRKNLSTK